VCGLAPLTMLVSADGVAAASKRPFLLSGSPCFVSTSFLLREARKNERSSAHFCFRDVAETWWDAGGIFACLDTDSFSARCQNREGHSPLAIHTAAFVHVLVLLAAGFALCFGENINLT
jgi:hypothetical protein